MKWKSTSGSQVVEMALVMPLLLVLVFGMVDFGFAIFDKAVITNAAREGARAAIVYVHPARSQGEVEAVVSQKVTDYCSSYLLSFGGTSDPEVQVSEVGPSGTPLTITVTYTYNYVAMSAFLGLDPLPLQGRTTMRME